MIFGGDDGSYLVLFDESRRLVAVGTLAEEKRRRSFCLSCAVRPYIGVACLASCLNFLFSLSRLLDIFPSNDADRRRRALVQRQFVRAGSQGIFNTPIDNIRRAASRLQYMMSSF